MFMNQNETMQAGPFKICNRILLIHYLKYINTKQIASTKEKLKKNMSIRGSHICCA